MDKSAYNRSHVSRRRRYSGASTPRRRSRFLSFLLACAGIFVFAVGINYLFPHFSKAVGDKVSSVVDYRSAFAIIGEGISGERKLTEAFAEAWSEAFNTEDGNIAVMSDDPDEATPAFADEPAVESSEFTDALLAAFSESQRGYADYMTPAGSDYSII